MTDDEAAGIRRQAQAIKAQALALVGAVDALLAGVPTEPEPQPERRIPRTLGGDD